MATTTLSRRVGAIEARRDPRARRWMKGLSTPDLERLLPLLESIETQLGCEASNASDEDWAAVCTSLSKPDQELLLHVERVRNAWTG